MAEITTYAPKMPPAMAETITNAPIVLSAAAETITNAQIMPSAMAETIANIPMAFPAMAETISDTQIALSATAGTITPVKLAILFNFPTTTECPVVMPLGHDGFMKPSGAPHKPTSGNRIFSAKTLLLANQMPQTIMTLQEKDKAYNRIIGSLDSKELKNAFEAMHALIVGSSENIFLDPLTELQNTYKYMLRYRIQGVKDPMQEQIYNRLQTSAYELADSIRHKVMATESPLAFFAMRRTMAMSRQDSLHDIRLRLLAQSEAGNQADYEVALTLLFNKIWTSDAFRAEDSSEVKALLLEPEMPFTAGCQVVSALLFGLLEAFDIEKLMLLMDAFSAGDEEISMRALVAILLTLYVYRKRTALYPQIADRLETLAEMPGFTRALKIVTLRFILARETEKITRKIRNEIIPGMMRMSSKIHDKINPKDITPKMLEDEMNPEWEDLLQDPSLGKAMEEFGELQQEGADVMHSTFVHLKSFPFFHETANWFLPFTPDYSAFKGRLSQVTSSLTTANFICNSDKYSLFFSLMSMPEEAQKIMMAHFESQASDLFQQSKNDATGKHDRQEIIIGQYIQDLYRFFKVHPRHLDFNDVFTLPLDFHNLDILQPYVSDDNFLRNLAEYYLHKNYFSDALTIFLRLAETDPENDVLFQKIGYCRQMTDDIRGALHAYLRADLLNPDSKWVIRRIAGCYRSLKQPEDALKYYRRYESLCPDNISVLISIGHCLLEMRDYNEALKYFYKVDYLDGSNKVWRPIAWCSFLTGKYDQARNYYKKIIADQPSAQDFLNAGHTEWALQNIKGAMDFYLQAVEKESGDFFKFKEEFDKDIPDLIIAGIENTEIYLMLDQLRYALSNTL